MYLFKAFHQRRRAARFHQVGQGGSDPSCSPVYDRMPIGKFFLRDPVDQVFMC